MCGRYAIQCEEENIELREIIDAIQKKYEGSDALAHMKTGEIFPTETVPALVSQGSQISPLLMHWGFPRWNAPGIIINARAETAMEKTMFRDSLRLRRCLLPSTGFYEWRHEEGKKKKDKFLIRPPETPVVYMAGLYNSFKNKEGPEIPSFVVLTTAANEWVSSIHDRMPVILSKEQSLLWLQDASGAAQMLSRPCAVQLRMQGV